MEESTTNPIRQLPPWNNIPFSLPEDQWKKVTHSEDVENIFISHNQAQLLQSQGTSFTINPLQDLTGIDSLTPFGNSLLLGTADLKKYPFPHFTNFTCLN